MWEDIGVCQCVCGDEGCMVGCVGRWRCVLVCVER